ncbi:PIG-L family deacetylase [Streptomyces sp. AV19]|uniref:PIG-L family deacetylase n=1 Tax=Streptomyces sp. AV19 TaxID=2793068 RepID=UPI001F162A7B|nr:PIG-L family deacetylase [Streptomyces sp. AV19]MDG4536889.1 PIG-L family deacetylase [Streptomyces sp. AV19]
MAALAAAGCRPVSEAAGTGPAARAKMAADNGGTGGAVTMQVVAHPDDDLDFMNPDVRQSIDANHRVVTVYVTSGEANGINGVPGEKKPRPDFAGYAGSRQQGLRQAYALMATGKPLAKWKRGVLDLPGGLRCEVDSLVERPGVTLVFLGICQHTADLLGAGEGSAGKNGCAAQEEPSRRKDTGARRTPRTGRTGEPPHRKDTRLGDLWSDPKVVTRTRVSTGSTVRGAHPVTRAGLIDALAGVLDRFRPTLIRTMDPDPDMQVHGAKHRPHHDQSGYSDHPDHTAVALFTHAALERYRGPGDGRHFIVTTYRGYYNERWPFNLPPGLVRGKADVINAYGGDPALGCGFAAGCGDFEVGRDRSYGTGWIESTNVRYPGTTTWLQRGHDGRLTAFGVLDQQAAMWIESAPGSGRFDAPRLLGGGMLAPALAISQTKDGRWQLFAERFAGLGADAEGNRREIVALEQESPGGRFGFWTSLGNPEEDPVRGRRVGAPAVARNADGSAQVFVRTWAKGVSTKRQDREGRWGEEWTDLGGAEVQEGLSAVTGSDGRIHVAGSGHDTVHHWVQERPGGDFALAAHGRLPVPADPPTLVAQPDGGLLLVFRQPRTARPLVYRLDDKDGQWEELGPGLVGCGYGVMAVAADPEGGERAVLVSRNDAGSLSAGGLGRGAHPRWAVCGEQAVGAPTIAVDAKGRLVVATLTAEGKLLTSRQPGPDVTRFA